MDIAIAIIGVVLITYIICVGSGSGGSNDPWG